MSKRRRFTAAEAYTAALINGEGSFDRLRPKGGKPRRRIVIESCSRDALAPVEPTIGKIDRDTRKGITCPPELFPLIAGGPGGWWQAAPRLIG